MEALPTQETKVAAKDGAFSAVVQEELGGMVHHVSSEMLRCSSRERSLHSTTMVVLQLLRDYSWGTKVVIVLVILSKCCGELWLVLQFCGTNSFAASIARLKGFGTGLGTPGSSAYWLKALRYLCKQMTDVAECILDFESLPERYVILDIEAMTNLKSRILIATYWAVRCTVGCASQITSVHAMNSKQMFTTSAVWELWSSALKMKYMQHQLQERLNNLSVQIEKCIYSNLNHSFEEVHDDNQKVLSMLFSLKDDFPLRNSSSQKKVGVAELTNKVVILFVSHPVIQLEKILLIIEQLQCLPHEKPQKLYEVVWIPIAHAIPWSEIEERQFSCIADMFPWYWLYEPSKLSLSVMKFIQEVWHFQDDPVMVILNSKGRVTCSNAIDMISVWGARAYPFTLSREIELWKEQSWTLEILLNGIDPLISYWMDSGRIICFYASNNIDWPRKFIDKMDDIKKAGILLELVYIGRSYGDQLKDNSTTIIKERQSNYQLSCMKICMFWLRLENIRSSKSRLGHTIESDAIMQEVTSLLSCDLENKGWVLVSEGSSNEIVKLYENEVLECLSLFHVWGEKVYKLGFTGSIRTAFDPPIIDNCGYYSVIPYVENMDEQKISCKNCNRPMGTHYMYQCGTSELIL